MGFSISKEYPSRFLRGEEVFGKAVNLKIKVIKKEKVFSMTTKKNEEVLVIYFEGKDRGVCLKKTRANDIKAIYGDNTDGWAGKDIVMYTEKKEAFGKVLNVIRFRPVK